MSDRKPGVLLNIKFDMEGKVAAFQKLLANRDIVNVVDGKPDRADLTGLAYAVVWKPTPGLLAQMPDLEVIFSLGAGVDHVYADPHLPNKPLVRFVDPDLTARMVEYVTLQVLMHMRQQRPYDALQKRRQWRELEQPTARQMRVGIMGFGELGQACAKALLALGFHVNGWARTAKQVAGVTCYAGDEQRGTFLGQTDILVSLLPYTPQTHGIINRSLIDQMAKDGPFGAPILINAGRGGSQVEDDIVSALNEGVLFGVSLDVFETEPLAADHPLWGYENAIITPHVAAISDRNAISTYVADQIEAYEAGKPLQNVVDPSKGY